MKYFYAECKKNYNNRVPERTTDFVFIPAFRLEPIIKNIYIHEVLYCKIILEW